MLVPLQQSRCDLGPPVLRVEPQEETVEDPVDICPQQQAAVDLVHGMLGIGGEVRRVLSGEWPINVVNKAVKGKSRAGL